MRVQSAFFVGKAALGGCVFRVICLDVTAWSRDQKYLLKEFVEKQKQKKNGDAGGEREREKALGLKLIFCCLPSAWRDSQHKQTYGRSKYWSSFSYLRWEVLFL